MKAHNLKAGILSILVVASLAVAARKKLTSDRGYWVAVTSPGEDHAVTVHYYNHQHHLLLSEKIYRQRFNPESRKQQLTLRRKTDLVAQKACRMKDGSHAGS